VAYCGLAQIALYWERVPAAKQQQKGTSTMTRRQYKREVNKAAAVCRRLNKRGAMAYRDALPLQLAARRMPARRFA
jgi:hypothetical protein